MNETTLGTSTPVKEEISSYIGMTILIAAFGMFFGSILVCYMVLRFRQPVWPPPDFPPLPQDLPLVSTLLLLSSSFFFHKGVQALNAGQNKSFQRFLSLTLLTGSSFIGTQLLLWQKVAHLGIYMESGALGAIFYGFTFLHGIHLIAGLIALLSLVPGAYSGRYLIQGSLSVRLVGIFWHFLDFTWILLYFVIFLV